jgi:hypothetical protein
MKLHSMFLRTGCLLPDGVGLIREEFSERWMSVKDASASLLDLKIRNAGWHFMWLLTTHSRLGLGRTADSAARNATAAALKRIEARFNGAELRSVGITRYPGFYVARVTLHTRQIQQRASLGLIDEMILRQLPAQ